MKLYLWPAGVWPEGAQAFVPPLDPGRGETSYDRVEDHSRNRDHDEWAHHKL